MKTNNIIKLAKEQAKFPLDQLEEKLQELKDKGIPLLSSIAFVAFNQGINLGEAKLLVLDSKTWEEESIEFWENNYAMWQDIAESNNKSSTSSNGQKVSTPIEDDDEEYIDIEDFDF